MESSNIPNSVSMAQLEALQHRGLPKWDGTFGRALDMGHDQIEALPDGYYQSLGQIVSLAIQSLANLDNQMIEVARVEYGHDTQAHYWAHDAHTRIQSMVCQLRSMMCTD